MIIEEHRMTQLGYALREYRVRHNMTQQDLAEQLGVSTNTIHLWGDAGMQAFHGIAAPLIRSARHAPSGYHFQVKTAVLTVRKTGKGSQFGLFI